MANSIEKGAISSTENTPERASRFLRNIIIVGAVALGGAGIALESTVLTGWGVLNAGQAGFFELTRRAARRSRLKSAT